LVKHTKSSLETIQFGKDLAKGLKRNDIIALTGDLGAGKTTLIQGIAKGLGIKNYVTSPTFTIINEFIGKIPLYHVDLYRLDKGDMDDIALEEYFSKGGVTVIEWAEKTAELLPNNIMKITIKVVSEKERSIKIEDNRAK
jgi:tRNA threonylcarbamoyladenosine biosynthesis protein TsaE